MTFRWLARLVNRLIPLDEEQGAGVGRIKLDPNHAVNRAAVLHDVECGEAIKAKSKAMYDKADMMFIYRCGLILKAEIDIGNVSKALDLWYDLADYFPAMRIWAKVRCSEFE